VTERLLLVGCGRMGGALLQGWLAGGTKAEDVIAVEPSGGAERFGDAPPRFVADASAVPPDFAPSVVILAVKPQIMDEVAPPYARFVGPDTVFLSIAAGKTVGFFEDELGAEAAIVRAMPNTPAAVGRGITTAVANAHVSAGQKRTCQALLEAVGEVGWVEDEALMDAVTAVSGSGPAYVFHLVECLAKAGEAQGLEPELAMRLARATVSGAGELMYRSSDSAEELRKAVTSPGGTTQAGLEVLMAELGDLMERTVAAAARRSRELAD